VVVLVLLFVSVETPLTDVLLVACRLLCVAVDERDERVSSI
jgi:hypothetical protein